MYSVTKIISFCYGHRLLNYEGKCQYLHGHNGRAEILIESEALDSLSMVIDFSDIKGIIGGFIDKELDHRMILSKKDPVVQKLKELKEPLFLIDENPTAENIAKVIYEFTREKGFPVSAVKLWETDTSFAIYQGNKV